MDEERAILDGEWFAAVKPSLSSFKASRAEVGE